MADSFTYYCVCMDPPGQKWFPAQRVFVCVITFSADIMVRGAGFGMVGVETTEMGGGGEMGEEAG